MNYRTRSTNKTFPCNNRLSTSNATISYTRYKDTCSHDQVHASTRPHVRMSTCPHVHTSARPQVHMSTHRHLHTSTLPHVNMCTCPHIHMCECPHVHTFTHPQLHFTCPQSLEMTLYSELWTRWRTGKFICCCYDYQLLSTPFS